MTIVQQISVPYRNSNESRFIVVSRLVGVKKVKFAHAVSAKVLHLNLASVFPRLVVKNNIHCITDFMWGSATCHFGKIPAGNDDGSLTKNQPRLNKRGYNQLANFQKLSFEDSRNIF